MLSFLQKFNNLPPEIRGKVSSPEAMSAMAGLEKEYGVSLERRAIEEEIKNLES